jgi:hypothetical protein
MILSQSVLEILDKCRVEGPLVFLPPQQLDRKMYVSVNKALECMGGKWNKKQQAHVFPDDPSDQLDSVLLTGDVFDTKKEFQSFYTPGPLATRVAEMADIQPFDDILEPSAGRGAIAIALRKHQFRTLTMVELSKDNYHFLCGMGLGSVTHGDFLKIPLDSFSKIVMNPPFSRQQDIDHTLHAYSLLKPKGILISIMSEGTFFRDTAKTHAFHKIYTFGYSEILPACSFKQSGTMVNARIVRIVKPT